MSFIPAYQRIPAYGVPGTRNKYAGMYYLVAVMYRKSISYVQQHRPAKKKQSRKNIRLHFWGDATTYDKKIGSRKSCSAGGAIVNKTLNYYWYAIRIGYSMLKVVQG